MKTWIWIAVLAACSKGGHNVAPKERPPEAVKAEWSPKVQAKLAKIVAAAKAADGADLGTPGDQKLALDFDWDDAAKPNAIAVQIDDVQSATAPRPKPPAAPTADAAWNAAAEGKPIALPGPPHPRFSMQEDRYNTVYMGKQLLGIEDSSVAREYVYDQLVSAKYVLVVVPGEVTWADPSGSKFEGGHVHMRATLVDIDAAKPLGGFEIDGVSSDKVLVDESSLTDPKYRDQLYAKLDRDLLIESSRAIVTGIAQRWPGAKTPLGWVAFW